jgi:O-antigen/teichoic acid export membrane protein
MKIANCLRAIICPTVVNMNMATSTNFLLRGTIWTLGAYGVGTGLRFVTNVVLARLLTPEIFGTMLIVYSLRTGIEMISDIGIGQNLVQSKNAEDPDFYNTAWSLQLIRSFILWLAFSAAAIPMAHFYQSPILVYIVPVTALSIIFAGLSSVGRSLMAKRLQIAKLNLFETILAVVGSTALIVFSWLSPTVWALVLGNLFGSFVAMIGSYFLVRDVKQRFHISKGPALEIIHFGKWIFISSMVYFLSTYIDRFYLGKVVPLEMLGIYGIARSISDLSGNLVVRLGSVVLFPFVASQAHLPRAELIRHLSPLRAKFLLLTGIGFSVFITTADWLVRLVYDERYQAMTWILPVLILGSWFTVLATLNESALLGIGKPSYAAAANSLKLIFLIVGLALGTNTYGLLGGVVVVAMADLCRYVPTLVGQVRERFSFGRQDLLITLTVLLMIGVFECARYAFGFGTSFDTLPRAGQ